MSVQNDPLKTMCIGKSRDTQECKILKPKLWKTIHIHRRISENKKIETVVYEKMLHTCIYKKNKLIQENMVVLCAATSF